MKQTLVFLIVLCGLFVGCSSPQAPSGEQIQAALDSAVKKDNPAATAKLTGIEMDKDGKRVMAKFTCTNCLHLYFGGNKKIDPSSEGTASVWLDPQDKKWKFMDIYVDNEGGGASAIHSDHIF
jgi:hypothetical protein